MISEKFMTQKRVPSSVQFKIVFEGLWKFSGEPTTTSDLVVKLSAPADEGLNSGLYFAHFEIIYPLLVMV